jgi:hypothetical protein
MAKYEVHIPAAAPGTPNVTLRVFADNWMAALKSGMEKVGEQGAQMQNVLCDILDDGSVDVTDPKSDRVFRIRELEGSDEPTPISQSVMSPVRSEADDREEKTDPELALPNWSAEEPSSSEDATEIGAPAPKPREKERTPIPLQKARTPAPVDDERTPVPLENEPPAPIPLRKKVEPIKPSPTPVPKPSPSKPAPKAPEPPKAAEAPKAVQQPKAAQPSKPAVAPPSPVASQKRLTQVARPKPRLVEVIDEPSMPLKGPIGRKSGKVVADPEEVLAELFERVQEANSMDRPKALYFFLDLAMSKIPAESGSVMVAPLGSGELRFAAARGPKSDELLRLNPKVPMGKGIAGFCTQESVALAISDAQRDKRFLRQISDRVGYETRSMICAPMSASGKTYGCLQIINRQGSPHFEDSELAILGYLAHQAANYLEAHGGA